jgi:hypothetical protein
LKLDEDFMLAFSPERVDPGNPNFLTHNIPKVVGGVTPDSTVAAAHLYSQIVADVYSVSSARVAEAAKLLENTFRAVNIGMANEMARLCYALNIDTWEVIRAAATKPFGFMPFYPGPGIGGHCIPLDPHYLSWKARQFNFEARFIDLAGVINSGMPEFVVRRVIDALNTQKKSLNGARVHVIGVAYKRDVNDLRESPALEVLELLAHRGATVSYTDPYVPEFKHAHLDLKSVPEKVMHEGIDCGVIITDHKVFDYQAMVRNFKLLVDTRNALKGVTRENIFRLSYDAYSNQYVTVRGNVDLGWRRGSGFVETGIDYEQGPGGTQPTLRYYDEADRDRTRGSIVITAMPSDRVDVFFQFAGTRDKYLVDESAPVDRPGEHFGLQRQTTTSYNVGFNFHPTDVVSLGANYGRDSFGSFQRSRNANPAPDPTWTDPSRDWTLDNDDHVNNVGLYVDMTRPVRNTDIRFGYDYSDSNNSFVHGGPRVTSLADIGQFIPLPNVENSWHRLTADVTYFLNTRVGVGVGYYFETLDVSDFNTIDTDGPVGFAPATGDPRLDWLGGLTLGYGNRPYTGHTANVRVVYRF